MKDALVRFWSIDHQGGTQLKWDASPWSRLVYTPKGALRLHGGNAEWTLPQTHGFWIGPEQSFAVTCIGRTALRNVYFHESVAPKRPDGVVEVSSLLRELLLGADRIAPLYEADAVARSFAILLIDQVGAAKSVPTGLPMPSDPIALQLARLSVASPQVDIEELVKQVAMSRRSLERHFVEETGLSLGRWRLRARMVEAIRLLSQGETVSEASWKVGYQNPSAFIHAFRGQFGVSPGIYKSQL